MQRGIGRPAGESGGGRLSDPACEYLALLGHTYLSHRRGAAAVAVFEVLADSRPDDPAASRSLAFALFLAGRHRDCVGHVERHRRRFPADPVADALLKLRARAWVRANQTGPEPAEGDEDDAVPLPRLLLS